MQTTKSIHLSCDSLRSVRLFSVVLLGTLLHYSTLVAAGEFDVRETCEDFGRKGALQGIDSSCGYGLSTELDPVFKNGSSAEVQAATEKLFKNCSYGHGTLAWVMLNYPRKEVGEGALWVQETLVTEAVKKMGISTDTWKLISDAADTAPLFSDEGKAKTHSLFVSLKANPYKAEDTEKSKTAAPAFCLDFGSLACAKPLRDILDSMKMYLWNGYVISQADLYEKYFTDPTFVQGAARIALRLYEVLGTARKTGKTESHLFEVAYQSYFSITKNHSKAKELAWDWIAIYATRGASWIGPAGLFYSENAALFASLTMAGTITTVLDGYAYTDSLSFSYPPQVSTTCFHGRPYHFWMAAYFSNRFYSRSVENPASIASYISGVLYEFASETFGRDPLKPFFLETFDTYNQSLRANLTYKALASNLATFEIDETGNFSKAPNLSIDEGLAYSVSVSEALPKWTEKERQDVIANMLTRYKYWKKLMGSQQVFKYFLDKTGT